ncbi:MAG: NADH-quinone oxidoreductase subunit L [Alphaproteobacteria bacterium]|nr:NADH-quinone oxidoreductase subunit L [Alphaproteobacteria bacterium]
MAILCVFLPFLGFLIAGLFGRQLGDKGAQYATCIPMILSAILSVFLFLGNSGIETIIPLFTWIETGTFSVSWALRLDTLSCVMMIVVTFVSTLVHIYSIGYMSHDKSIPRFMAYLSLFTFFMLMLVTANNLLQLFFGWEGVGLASYLLIGFWYKKATANAASIKAFLVNRVGDFGFALGIFACFYIFGSVSFDDIFRDAASHKDKIIHFLGHDFHAMTLITFLLFIGAMGKSAQLGLHTWLPDAMEGPTPVSALIHAATMVTAGVFMVARMSPLFELAPDTLAFVTIIGGLTALFAATIALTQNDIKRVIAYSTCSQLGYMFFAAGLSAYDASIFHLATHAFFKALLFLGAGSVIHALSGEQDMRQMGGIWRLIPTTYVLMWIGSLALAGIPIFAGYYSKDLILESAFASGAHGHMLGYFAYAIGILTALLTAFYSWRLIFLTFHGKPRAHERVMAHVHESPFVMIMPLVMLAIGAVFAGILGIDYFTSGHAFWGKSIVTNHGGHPHVPFVIEHLTLVVVLLGIYLAYIFYLLKPTLPAKMAQKFKALYQLSYNKYYVDELYDLIFVRPSFIIGRIFWKAGDGFIIDGLGPDGISKLTMNASLRISRFQTGYLYHYAFVMLLGVFALMTWMIYKFLI